MVRKLLIGLIVIISLTVIVLLVLNYDFISNWVFPNNPQSRGEFLKILLSVIGGVGVLFGIYASLKRAKAIEEGVKKQGESLNIQNLQIELTRKAQIDERFKNAVEHLGSDKEPVILGGIAELHQIAKENSSNYAEIVFNIFCSYIRSNSQKEGVVTILQTIVDYSFVNYKDNPYFNFRANLRRAKLAGVKFDNCVFDRTDFAFCELSDVKATTFKSCNLSNSTFFATNVEQCNFLNCKFYKAIFFLGTIHSSKFSFTDHISPITFFRSELTEVQISKDTISDWRFIGAKLRGVMINAKTIISTKFLITDFNDVTFNNIDLFGKNDFRGSNMSNVLMKGIVITNSNFNGITRYKEIGLVTKSEIINLKSNFTDIGGLNGVIKFYRSSLDPISDKDVQEILSLYEEIHDKILPPKTEK